jgi:heat shock protein HslJ
MKKIVSSIVSLLMSILIVSCHSTKPISGGTTGGSEMLYQYQWDATEIQGKVISTSSDNQPYLLFSPGQVSRVSGSTGCNRLNGSFELTGVNFIKFSPLATTKMACIGDNVETKFLGAMGKVNNWSIINNQLLLNNGKMNLIKLKAVTPESAKLSGTWELNYISGPRIAFNGLYPDKKPVIAFKLDVNELGGNTSCNGFSSKITIDKNKITIAAPFAKTMIFCEGGGEETFLNMLRKVNKFAVDGNTLTFLIDDVAVMRFARKTTAKG